MKKNILKSIIKEEIINLLNEEEDIFVHIEKIENQSAIACRKALAELNKFHVWYSDYKKQNPGIEHDSGIEQIIEDFEKVEKEILKILKK